MDNISLFISNSIDDGRSIEILRGEQRIRRVNLILSIQHKWL